MPLNNQDMLEYTLHQASKGASKQGKMINNKYPLEGSKTG
jgi:hypothetical protein